MKIYKILKKDVRKRLDVFLSEKFPEFSRSQIQKEIRARRVTINLKPAKPSSILKLGDAIKASRLFCYRRKDVTLGLKPNKNIKINIVYEDKNLAVINKQPGLLVHPTKKEYKNTLVNALLYHVPSIKNVGGDPLRSGIVHRLDKDTSGLIIVAKNNEMFIWLKQQFAGRKVKKKYLAFVYGVPKEKHGYITSSIGKLKGRQTTGIAIRKLGLKSREAETEYLVRKTYGNLALLEVTPLTGRTHQIRVHLASIGHPVVGDTLYKFKRSRPPKEILRQFLHAYFLKFRVPSGKALEFKINLPEDLKRVLSALEKENNT